MTKLDLVVKELENISNGQFFNITYKTELPISKRKMKENGYEDLRITKYVTKVVRTGINYGKIKSVVEKKLKEGTFDKPIKHNPNESWILKNKVKYNNNTDKYYITLASVPQGHHTKVEYSYTINNGEEVFNNQKTLEEVMNECVQTSYNNSNNVPAYYCVNVENLISVNGKEVK